jgi:hypothetical protein
MAVGQYSAHGKVLPLAQIWNGRAWSLTRAPAGTAHVFTTLSGVSCRAATICQAAGFVADTTFATGLSLTLAQGWGGKRLHALAGPGQQR